MTQTTVDDFTSTGPENVVAPESAEQALGALRSARRHRRIVDVDPFDALYKAYLGGSAALLGAYAATHALGEAPIVGTQLDDVLTWAPRIAGLIIAIAWGVGARSGGRGGPVSLERADVFHVLLGPVERRFALRAPAIRAIRFAAFVGFCTGGLAGLATAQRIDGLPLVWIAAPAVVGAIGLGGAAALGVVISGLGINRLVANLIAVCVVAPSIADVGLGIDVSPFTWLAKLSVAAKDFEPLGLFAVVLPVVTLLVALRVVGGLSIEAAERRAALVTQLRFAATVRDVRAVMQLRRQLSNESPRSRPWLRLSRGVSPLIFVRDVRSILRWPLMRIIRLFVFGGVAGVVIVAVWRGNTSLIVVLGLLSYLIGLESVEPLAEEADRPDLVRSYPRTTGWLMLGHLPSAYLVALISLTASMIVPLIIGVDGITVPVLLLSIACASMGALVGGAMSALANANFGTSGSPDMSAMGADALSIILMIKIIAPPLMCTLAWTPLVVARAAWLTDRPVAGATAASVGAIAMLFVIFCGWLRFRDEITAYTSQTREIAKSTYDPKAIVEHFETVEKGGAKP